MSTSLQELYWAAWPPAAYAAGRAWCDQLLTENRPALTAERRVLVEYRTWFERVTGRVVRSRLTRDHQERARAFFEGALSALSHEQLVERDRLLGG